MTERKKEEIKRKRERDRECRLLLPVRPMSSFPVSMIQAQLLFLGFLPVPNNLGPNNKFCSLASILPPQPKIYYIRQNARALHASHVLTILQTR